MDLWVEVWEEGREVGGIEGRWERWRTGRQGGEDGVQTGMGRERGPGGWKGVNEGRESNGEKKGREGLLGTKRTTSYPTWQMRQRELIIALFTDLNARNRISKPPSLLLLVHLLLLFLPNVVRDKIIVL